MSTAVTCQISSTDSAATETLAEQIGKRLKGGEVIELASDLGGGKTTFVRGLARGLGSKNVVSSPTFTISKIYEAGDLSLHHFDFYRLPEAGLIAHELNEVLGDSRTVVVVEWGDVVKDVLPDERLRIEFKRTGEETRKLILTCPENLKYLLEGIC